MVWWSKLCCGWSRSPDIGLYRFILKLSHLWSWSWRWQLSTARQNCALRYALKMCHVSWSRSASSKAFFLLAVILIYGSIEIDGFLCVCFPWILRILKIVKSISKHESLRITESSGFLVYSTSNLHLTFTKESHWAQFRSWESRTAVGAIRTALAHGGCRFGPRPVVAAPSREFLSPHRLPLAFRIIADFTIASGIFV